jgi:hypothetical protein
LVRSAIEHRGWRLQLGRNSVSTSWTVMPDCSAAGATEVAVAITFDVPTAAGPPTFHATSSCEAGSARFEGLANGPYRRP